MPQRGDERKTAARLHDDVLTAAEFMPFDGKPHSSLAADQACEAWEGYSTFTVLSRSAFAITLTEESAIAAAATMGDSSSPKNG